MVAGLHSKMSLSCAIQFMNVSFGNVYYSEFDLFCDNLEFGNEGIHMQDMR